MKTAIFFSTLVIHRNLKFMTEDNKITNEQVLDTLGSGHGALAGFLSGNNVNILICGGIGDGAKTALKDAGIQLYGGVSGNASQAVKSLLTGNLNYNHL